MTPHLPAVWRERNPSTNLRVVQAAGNRPPRMHRLRHAFRLGLGLLIAVTIGQAGRAVAGDLSTELAAGGLVLDKTDSVSMEREDLTISPTEIRVRYRMRNDTGRPVQLRVAFPMPEVPKATPAGLSTATSHNIIMPPIAGPNFLGFRVWADGREITPEVEMRATLPDGRDVTDPVRRIGGASLLLHTGTFEQEAAPALPGTEGSRGLDPVARGKLEALGALEQDENVYELRWTTRITLHWMQVFDPGVTVLEFRYRPVVGTHSFEVKPDTPLNRHEKQRYCIDPPTERAIRSTSRRGDLTAYTLGYVLQTANTWRGPIGTFHLTLQGDQVATVNGRPAKVRMMSLCTDLPLRQTGPMRFEATMSDYVPAYDLLLLVLAD